MAWGAAQTGDPSKHKMVSRTLVCLVNARATASSIWGENTQPTVGQQVTGRCGAGRHLMPPRV